MSDTLTWSLEPQLYPLFQTAMLLGGAGLVLASLLSLSRYLRGQPEIADGDLADEQEPESAELAPSPELVAEPEPPPERPAVLQPAVRVRFQPTQPALPLPAPQPASPAPRRPKLSVKVPTAGPAAPAADMGKDLGALIAARPDARRVCRWFDLPAGRKLKEPGRARDETLRILACWEWLGLVGAPEQDVRFLLGQLGRNVAEPGRRLGRLLTAVGEIVPAFITDDLSRVATEALVTGMAGPQARLIWARPGDLFDHALHTPLFPPPQTVISRLVSPGFVSGEKEGQSALVDTSPAAAQESHSEPKREIKTPFIDMLARWALPGG